MTARDLSVDFDPRDPIPWVEEDQWTYAREQAHSERVDEWLGLRTEETEARVQAETKAGQDENLWVGLPVTALLTPYTETRRMLAMLALPPGARIVDLGAGYGRMAFVIQAHFPELSFTGYEKVGARDGACTGQCRELPKLNRAGEVAG